MRVGSHEQLLSMRKEKRRQDHRVDELFLPEVDIVQLCPPLKGLSTLTPVETACS